MRTRAIVTLCLGLMFATGAWGGVVSKGTEVAADALTPAFKKAMQALAEKGFLKADQSAIKRLLKEMIEKYGDDVLVFAEKYGPDAFVQIEKHGDVAVKIIKGWGDEGLARLLKDGDKFISVGKVYGDDGIATVVRHGEMGHKVIEEFGEASPSEPSGDARRFIESGEYLTEREQSMLTTPHLAPFKTVAELLVRSPLWCVDPVFRVYCAPRMLSAPEATRVTDPFDAYAACVLKYSNTLCCFLDGVMGINPDQLRAEIQARILDSKKVKQRDH